MKRKLACLTVSAMAFVAIAVGCTELDDGAVGQLHAGDDIESSSGVLNEEEGLESYVLLVLEDGVPAPGARVVMKTTAGVHVGEDTTDDSGLVEMVVKPSEYTIEADIGGNWGAMALGTKQRTGILELGEETSEPGDLETQEFALTNPVCAYNVAKKALELQDPTNHCYAACQIKRSCGTTLVGTALLSVAKEVCDVFKVGKYCHDFSWSDLWADMLGISCSYQFWKPCLQCCPK